jgi:hypothetical protein
VAMAEASGSRTHRRRGDPPPAGFEDRGSHRTTCASIIVLILLHRWMRVAAVPTARLKSRKFLPNPDCGYAAESREFDRNCVPTGVRVLLMQ